MGLYSKIPGFCGAPWAVGAPRIVTTFHPTSNGPAYSMCVRLQYSYKVIISSLINLSMSKTVCVYTIIDYTTLSYYFQINFEMINILNYCPWTSRVLL